MPTLTFAGIYLNNNRNKGCDIVYTYKKNQSSKSYFIQVRSPIEMDIDKLSSNALEIIVEIIFTGLVKYIYAYWNKYKKIPEDGHFIDQSKYADYFNSDIRTSHWDFVIYLN